MARLSTKHPKREEIFRFLGYAGGYVQDKEAQYLDLNQLSECVNLKFGVESDSVILNVRQGTTVISNSALPSAADVMACTYYVNASKYILATASKLYYLDASSDPVEIGSSFLEGVPTFTEFNSKLIIHDSGVTKFWDGTTSPVLNTNYGKVTRLYENVIIGTGDDVTVNFSGTLGHPAVKASSVTITFTTSSTSSTITDNGTGALTGDVDGGGTNTITYATGAYDFTCSAAPDCDTSVTITYKMVDGAAKSQAGLVRGSRLYTWGDSDNPSRITYSEVNDETATDTTSGGGYLDVDKNDGYALLGAINFFTTVLCLKEQSLHRIDDFPEDATFDVEKLTDDLGTCAHRTPMFEGGIISFLYDEGWIAMSSAQRFGDIQKGVPLSKNFKKNAVAYANATGYSAYNPLDNQLWLSLSTDGGSTYLDYIYVSNLDANGVVSLYRFAFSHTCFASTNGEMLIGGADGNLYKLDNTNTVFTDNEVSYSDDTYFRSAFTDWNLPNNKKHNKRVRVNALTKATTFTAKLKFFRDGQQAAFNEISVSSAQVSPFVYGSLIYVYDMQTMPIFSFVTEFERKKKFNYKKIMYEMAEISVSSKTDIKGIDFTSAVLGD